MQRLTCPDGTTLSFDTWGSGPPLVLVHGCFSDHDTNWTFVRPLLAAHFTLYALARRGRGETDATRGHSLVDEARDVAELIGAIGEPVFLLGHSHGAQCALAAAALAPDRVRKLVLYEPPWPGLLTPHHADRLERLAAAGAWDELCVAFFRDTLLVPAGEVESVRGSALWAPVLADAPASMGDLRALTAYRFDPAGFGDLHVPVLLQVGSESPRHLFATDALAGVLPDVRVQELQGQAHEGMTTAPGLYAAAVVEFLLGAPTAGALRPALAAHV